MSSLTATVAAAAATTVTAIAAVAATTAIPHHLSETGVNMLLSLLQNAYEIAGLLGIWLRVSGPPRR